MFFYGTQCISMILYKHADTQYSLLDTINYVAWPTEESPSWRYICQIFDSGVTKFNTVKIIDICCLLDTIFKRAALLVYL